MAGLLGDVLPAVFSAGDRAKRYLGGLLSDPMGRIEQTLGQASDNVRQLGLLSQQAYGDKRDPLKVTNPQAAKQYNDAMFNMVSSFAPAGMFVGKGAKVWDVLNAEKAQQMAQKGVDPRVIWKETGTFQGPDGHWRQEVDDSRAAMRLMGPKFGDESNVNKLGETLDHRLAYDSYPDIKRINVTYSDVKSGGSYANPRSYAEYIDLPRLADNKGQTSTALHELQHAIQERERWASGGSPDQMAVLKSQAKREWDHWSNIAAIRQEAEANGGDFRKAAQDIGEIFDFSPDLGHVTEARGAESLAVLQAKADAARKSMIPYSEHEAYRRLAGEAEARATQARMKMNAAQRREVFPLDSYDVPIDQLIIR